MARENWVKNSSAFGYIFELPKKIGRRSPSAFLFRGKPGNGTRHDIRTGHFPGKNGQVLRASTNGGSFFAISLSLNLFHFVPLCPGICFRENITAKKREGREDHGKRKSGVEHFPGTQGKISLTYQLATRYKVSRKIRASQIGKKSARWNELVRGSFKAGICACRNFDMNNT